MANANAPLMLLYRNQIGAQKPGNRIALRFVGGNHSAQPSDWSNRDGYGVQIRLQLGTRQLLRELRSSDGMAQSSATLLIGLGDATQAEQLEIRWPSGRVQTLETLAAGQLLTVYEDPSRAPGRQAFVQVPYTATQTADPSAEMVEERFELAAEVSAARLKVFTSMASWCANCKRELPQWQALRAHFNEPQLGLYALPIDPEDSVASLQAWLGEHQPAYTLLPRPLAADREALQKLVVERLRRDALPASVITDAEGRVLQVQWGAPSLSDIRRLLAELEP